MTEYLAFTLAAPMASFGSIAVGERRPTWSRPSKSQILGLIAGALGIERTEEARHNALAGSLGFAVRVDDPGRLASDYHTAQVPPARRNQSFATRAEELAADKLKTILSMREYRTGTIHTIVLWRTGDGAPELNELATALCTPGFVPFAGRKAHPLMLPMAPRVVAATGIWEALAAYDSQQTKDVTRLRKLLGLLPEAAGAPVYADADGLAPGFVARLEERRDIPESRSKWRFGFRTEALLKTHVKGGPA